MNLKIWGWPYKPDEQCISLIFGVQVAPYTKRKHVKFMISKERLILQCDLFYNSKKSKSILNQKSLLNILESIKIVIFKCTKTCDLYAEHQGTNLLNYTMTNVQLFAYLSEEYSLKYFKYNQVSDVMAYVAVVFIKLFN